MRYIPFSELEPGAIFTRLEDVNQLWLKTTTSARAVCLTAVWVAGRLIPRGHTAEIPSNEAVVIHDEIDGKSTVDMPLDIPRPLDPRREFWTSETLVKTGHQLRGEFRAFSGLYVYSGCGSGRYFAKTNQEILYGSSTEFRAKAESEGVPFVYVDGFEYVSPTSLQQARQRAQDEFVRRTVLM